MKPVDTRARYDDGHDLLSTDGDVLRAARGAPLPPLVACPYRVASALPPLEALRAAGVALELSHLESAIRTASGYGDVVIVELPGAGDAPLAEDGGAFDLAVRLEARVLVVGLPGHEPIEPVLSDARRRGLVAFGLTNRASPQHPGWTLGEHAHEAAIDAELAEQRVLERCFAPASH